VETGLFHADGQIDMTKLIVVFHNCANAPEILYVLPTQCIPVFRTAVRTWQRLRPMLSDWFMAETECGYCAARTVSLLA